ncbi:hypothetical protein V6N13_030707 [Hibiscus sabdariffa]
MDSPLPAISLLLFSLFSAAYSSTLGVQYISKLLQIQDRERAPPALQIAAARAVLHRLLPSHSSAFEFRIISKKFNITNSDLDDFFGGPAFLAWSRMGNLHCDTFDENTPPVDDPGYISSLGAAIFSGMQSGDENATWLMQALLHSVPLGKLVVLDLFAEVKPIWISSEQFYGHFEHNWTLNCRN